MSRTLASTLSLCCLTLLLPCAAPVWAEEPAPAPAPADAAPAAAEAPAEASAEIPAAPPTEHAAVPERSENEAQGLQQQLPNTEQQQLTTSDGNFLALWKPANAAESSGVVILIPGDSESADWPQAIGPLRNKLPDVGWSSLSLTLPDPMTRHPRSRPRQHLKKPPAQPPKPTQRRPPLTRRKRRQMKHPPTQPKPSPPPKQAL